MHISTQQDMAAHGMHTASHSNTLKHTVSHRITRQHTAAHIPLRRQSITQTITQTTAQTIHHTDHHTECCGRCCGGMLLRELRLAQGPARECWYPVWWGLEGTALTMQALRTHTRALDGLGGDPRWAGRGAAVVREGYLIPPASLEGRPAA